MNYSQHLRPSIGFAYFLGDQSWITFQDYVIIILQKQMLRKTSGRKAGRPDEYVEKSPNM
jgi:hypothetical protein